MVFRTQSAALLTVMSEFFRLWKRIEDTYLAPLIGQKLDYALYDGRFTRSMAMPERDCTAEELAGAISDYIKFFDRMMKGYISGRLSPRDVESAYYSELAAASLHI